MYIVVEINQQSKAFLDSPSDAVKSAMAHIGQRLVNGAVEGQVIEADGNATVFSWLVTEYDGQREPKHMERLR